MSSNISGAGAAARRANILGVGVSAMNMPMAVQTIEGWIENGEQHYVCVVPVHSVMDCQRDDHHRRIVNRSGMTTPDGMPVVWLCRLKGFRDVRRVYGPDLMLEMCRVSEQRKYRHYLLGGAEGVPEKLVANLTKRFPLLDVAGFHSPPFRDLTPAETDEMIAHINQSKPDILWVGLGSPKQERWMAEHIGALDAPVIIGVGAAFDLHAGIKKQAPRWMQQSGLEWLFRLASEPRRLWKRYLTANPAFVLLITLQALGLKKYTVDT